MLRDFAIVSTPFGVDFAEIKKAGISGTVSLFAGIIVSFIVGALVAFSFGYSDAISMTTIGAGAATYIVGPVTGTAIGATSEVITLSVAATDPRRVPYDAMTATFYTGLGCLMGPSLMFIAIRALMG